MRLIVRLALTKVEHLIGRSNTQLSYHEKNRPSFSFLRDLSEFAEPLTGLPDTALRAGIIPFRMLKHFSGDLMALFFPSKSDDKANSFIKRLGQFMLNCAHNLFNGAFDLTVTAGSRVIKNAMAVICTPLYWLRAPIRYAAGNCCESQFESLYQYSLFETAKNVKELEVEAPGEIINGLRGQLINLSSQGLG